MPLEPQKCLRGDIQAVTMQPMVSANLTLEPGKTPANHANSLVDAGKTDLRPQARFGAKQRDEDCLVYFLAGAGLIKIGVTSDLTSRLRAIRNSSPVPIELLATIPGQGIFKEMRLHSQFAKLRRHGEWFEDEGSIRAHIDQLVEWRAAERPK